MSSIISISDNTTRIIIFIFIDDIITMIMIMIMILIMMVIITILIYSNRGGPSCHRRPGRGGPSHRPG